MPPCLILTSSLPRPVWFAGAVKTRTKAKPPISHQEAREVRGRGCSPLLWRRVADCRLPPVTAKTCLGQGDSRLLASVWRKAMFFAGNSVGPLHWGGNIVWLYCYTFIPQRADAWLPALLDRRMSCGERDEQAAALLCGRMPASPRRLRMTSATLGRSRRHLHPGWLLSPGRISDAQIQ